jgi:hypothetical protein
MTGSIGPGLISPREVSEAVVAVDSVIASHVDPIVVDLDDPTSAHEPGIVVVDQYRFAWLRHPL